MLDSKALNISRTQENAGGISDRYNRTSTTTACLSNRVIRALRDQLGTGFPIIGVGGIFSGEDAIAKIRAGANLVQIYTCTFKIALKNLLFLSTFRENFTLFINNDVFM